jgi:hypothetical protein
MKKQPGFSFLYTIQYLMVFLIASSCSNKVSEADAYGNFEADEIIVSAQSQGILQFLDRWANRQRIR